LETKLTVSVPRRNAIRRHSLAGLVIECRAQTRRPAADDDGVEDFRVERAKRLGCDHNGDLKSSATAQDENQQERAYHGNNQGTDAPEAVGEECEHYP